MTKLEMKSIIRSLLISSNFVLRIDDPEGDFKELVGNQAVNSSNTKQTNTESNIPKNVQENLQILISYFKEGKRLKKSYPLTTMATK
ncbi:uncharacterized protein LOC143195055 isoform X4 [Rhynchophorus ferrugineus]|uniref:uncharacterized protein LOC143195055 isoform X4 n=1 Tax=Rhynchophorus ferrugineus TaxID=354439 RepID=UPI003FCE31C5